MRTRTSSPRMFARNSPSRPSRGFTLIELMVGLLISTLIVTSAAALFVSMLDSWERGSRSYKMLQAAQTTGDLVERYLRCAVPPTSDSSGAIFWGEDLSVDEAYGHSLTFLSTAGGRFPRTDPPSDRKEIEFIFDPQEDALFSMRIDPSSGDDSAFDGGYLVDLSEMVESFQVLYHDGEEWLDEWIGSELPRAVEFRITFADPEDLSPITGEPKRYQVSRLIAMPMAGQFTLGREFETGEELF